MAQSIEPDEELVDPHLIQLSYLPERLFNQLRLKLNQLKLNLNWSKLSFNWSKLSFNWSRSDQRAIEVQRLPTKH